ncbi:MAG: hypothetical protein ACJASX_001009 [Limisphaerales bacterium]|jgi:hypothetical protein
MMVARRSFHPVPVSLDISAPEHLLVSWRYWFSSGFVAAAIEAECKRSLVIAAIAVERFRLHIGTYPATLENLIPEYLIELPLDWYDGQPIRYQRLNPESYNRWSTGNDGIDNACTPPSGPEYKLAAPDLVWMKPATLAEVEKHRIEYRKGKNFDPPGEPKAFGFEPDEMMDNGD